jgi:hypothetical protein
VLDIMYDLVKCLVQCTLVSVIQCFDSQQNSHVKVLKSDCLEFVCVL